MSEHHPHLTASVDTGAVRWSCACGHAPDGAWVTSLGAWLDVGKHLRRSASPDPMVRLREALPGLRAAIEALRIPELQGDQVYGMAD